MKTPLVLWCAALAVGVRIPRLNQVIPWTIKKNTEVVHRTPSEILADIADLDAQSAEALETIRTLIG